KNNTIYGKYYNNNNKNQTNNETTNLIHYQPTYQISPTTSPARADWESPHMLKCTGCKGNHNNNQDCIIRVRNNKSIKIPYIKDRDGELKLRITIGELEKARRINSTHDNSQTYDNNNTINSGEERI